MINIKYILSIGLSIITITSGFAIALEMKGIAFSQAAENGTFYCLDTDVVAAAACAKLLCESTSNDACFVTRYCWPALNSGVMKFHGDDLQYNIAFCGQTSVDALISVAQARCEEQKIAGDCFITNLLDAKGMELPLPDVKWNTQK